MLTFQAVKSQGPRDDRSPRPFLQTQALLGEVLSCHSGKGNECRHPVVPDSGGGAPQCWGPRLLQAMPVAGPLAPGSHWQSPQHP